MCRIPVVLSIVLLAFLHTANAAEKPSCQLQRYASIEIAMQGGEILVPMTIGDSQVRMMLNIQSGISVIWDTAVQQRGLKTRSLTNKEVYFGKSHITQYTEIPSLSVGQLKINDALFLIADARTSWDSRSDPVPIVGAIGMNFFSRLDFEVDFKNHQLNLYSQEHCPDSAVYWADTYTSVPLHRGRLGNAYFPMELDGQKIQATFATGHSHTSLTTDVTKRLYGWDEHSEGVETTQEPDAQARSSYRAMAIITPGLELRNTRVQLITPTRPCKLTIPTGSRIPAQYTDCLGREAPLNLGMDVIKHLHLYFATKENVVYMTDVDAQKATLVSQPDAKAN